MALQVFSEVFFEKTKQQRVLLQEHACYKVLYEMKREWEESVFMLQTPSSLANSFLQIIYRGQTCNMLIIDVRESSIARFKKKKWLIHQPKGIRLRNASQSFTSLYF